MQTYVIPSTTPLAEKPLQQKNLIQDDIRFNSGIYNKDLQGYSYPAGQFSNKSNAAKKLQTEDVRYYFPKSAYISTGYNMPQRGATCCETVANTQLNVDKFKRGKIYAPNDIYTSNKNDIQTRHIVQDSLYDSSDMRPIEGKEDLYQLNYANTDVSKQLYSPPNKIYKSTEHKSPTRNGFSKYYGPDGNRLEAFNGTIRKDFTEKKVLSTPIQPPRNMDQSNYNKLPMSMTTVDENIDKQKQYQPDAIIGNNYEEEHNGELVVFNNQQFTDYINVVPIINYARPETFKQIEPVKIHNDTVLTDRQILEGFRHLAKEKYTNNGSMFKEMYINVLQTHANSLTNFVNNTSFFSPWKTDWKRLQTNLHKCNCLFEILDASDADVAYVENKGERMKFRIRDNDRYVALSVYMYVLIHELAHLANNEYGHGEKFQQLMHLLEVAGLMLKILNPKTYPEHKSLSSNGQTILSKNSIIDELNDGINILLSNNPGYANEINQMRNYINTI